jgi:hypothetical protein
VLINQKAHLGAQVRMLLQIGIKLRVLALLQQPFLIASLAHLKHVLLVEGIYPVYRNKS